MEGVALGKYIFYLPVSMPSFHKLLKVKFLGDITLCRTSVNYGNIRSKMNGISCDI